MYLFLQLDSYYKFGKFSQTAIPSKNIRLTGFVQLNAIRMLECLIKYIDGYIRLSFLLLHEEYWLILTLFQHRSRTELSVCKIFRSNFLTALCKLNWRVGSVATFAATLYNMYLVITVCHLLSVKLL